MKYFLYLFLIVSAFGCAEDDNLGKPDNHCSDLNCDKCVLIDSAIFNDTQTTNYFFRDIKIIGNCLKIKYAGSGCDGESFEVDLIDSGAIDETTIEQRNLKFKLIENEDCEAVIIKEISFDLTPLQINNKKVLLNIEKWEESILYEY